MEEYGAPFGAPFVTDEDGDPIVYPDNTKFFVNRFGEIKIVIEDKPRLRTIKVDNFGYNGREGKVFHLAFPYFIYILSFRQDNTSLSFYNLEIAYRNSPLRSMNDTLYQANLPNLNVMAVCLGWRGGNAKNLAKQCERCITNFWNSTFNGDASGHFTAMARQDRRLRTFYDWEVASNSDPLFVLKVKWPEAGRLDFRGKYHVDRETNSFVNGWLARTFSDCVSKLPSIAMEELFKTVLRDAATAAFKEALAKEK